jgi:hypothetical protein
MARLLRLSLVSVISFYTFCVLSIYRADAVVITVSLNSYGDVGNSNFRDEALTGSLNGTAFNIPLNPKASNGDLANPAAKASYIAGQIMNNSGLSVALNGNTLTARPKPTQILFPFKFVPGIPIGPNLPIHHEKVTIQPEAQDFQPLFNAVIPRLVFSLADINSNVASAGGSIELDIGGPGGGKFIVSDTTDLKAADVLSDLKTEIDNTPSELLSAQVMGNDLLISNVTFANFIAAEGIQSSTGQDLNLAYSYGFTAVIPEPSTIVLFTAGFVVLSVAVRWRRT